VATVRDQLILAAGGAGGTVRAALAGIGAAPPSAATIAAAVLAAAALDPIASNMKEANDEAIIGDGSTANKFRSHLVP